MLFKYSDTCFPTLNPFDPLLNNSLILPVGYLPDNDFIKKMNLIMDGDMIHSENNITSVEGVFITGTMRTGVKELFNSGSNGFKVGKQVSEYLNSIVRHVEMKN